MSPSEESEIKWQSKHFQSFEEILDIIGITNPMHILLFVMCSLSAMAGALNTLAYQFLGATPDHWCHVEPLVKANWTREEILWTAIPFDNATSKPSSCLFYDLDYDKLALEAIHTDATFDFFSESNTTMKTIACNKREFAASDPTVVTEWDLVCERRYLYASTQAAVQGGILIGSLLFGFLIDRYGRKKMYTICLLIYIPTGIATAFSSNVYIYILMRIASSGLIFGSYIASFVLALEICALKQRSYVGTYYVLPWAFGFMIVPGIAYFVRPWYYLQVALTIPATLLLVNTWFLPESPRWLVLNGRFKEAFLVLKKFAKYSKSELPSEPVVIDVLRSLKIVNPKDEEKCDNEISFLSKVKENVVFLFSLLIHKELRMLTLVVFFCWFSVSMVYYGISLNATNLSADPYLYIFLGGLLELPSYLVLWPAVVFFGRRNTLIIYYVICGVAIFSVMGVMLTPYKDSVGLLMFFSLLGKFAITPAFHLAWVYTAELYPTKYRSLAVGEASVCARLGSICSPYVNDLLSLHATWAPSAVFGVFSLVASVVAFSLPETKNRKLNDEVVSADDSKAEQRLNIDFITK